MKAIFKTHVLFLTLLSTAGLAHAQSTAFTYNGRLNDNGLPVNGVYEMSFKLYDADVGGLLIANAPPASMVPVSSGLFTVRIDFGADKFTGPPRWLEVSVRPANAPTFTLLTPRQEVTSSPYAIRAQSAGTAASVANGTVTADQLNTGGVAPTPGQFLSYNNGNLFWSAPGVAAGNIWSLNGSSAYYNAGNVGIGTTTPAHRLSLSGGPAWTANSWGGAIALPHAAAIGWAANSAGQRFGMGHTDGGFYLFRTASNPGTTGSPALYDFMLDDSGNVGIGTITPAAGYRLEVAGATILRPANGTVQFGTPNAEIGMSITPTLGNRADLRFNGSSLKLVASYGVGPPPAEFGITVSTNGYVGVGKAPTFKLDVFSDTTTAIVGRSTVASGIGVYGESSQFNGVRGLAHNANHGGVVGVHDGGGIAVYGTGATGVQGDASSAGGFGGFFRNTAGGVALRVQGTAQVNVLQILGGADLAEPFELSARDIAKGSVVIIDEEHPGKLQLSTRAYDTRVAGIVSGANGVNPGITLHQEGVLEGGQNVALSGRVYVQADAVFGAIKPGDLLTTSDSPGHAMKVADHTKAQGAILGKAMSGLKEGKGMVLVLVTLQ